MSAGRRFLRLGLLLAVLALAAALYVYQQVEYPHPAAPASDITLFFPLGTSTASIFRRLGAEGVLRYPWFAEAYYRVARSATPLQAGEYRFERPAPLTEVIDRMSRGDVVRHVIVVPEGLTAEETFELFWSRGISRPAAFRNAFRNPQLVDSIARGAPDLEGFLYPDTYAVTRSTSARQIVETMLANFRRHLTPELRERARQNGLSLRETVTLASIVQKETALPREGAIIAGIYWNRLHRGMRLQADPTVVYALKGDGKWTGILYRSDYGYESPYNTYLHEGLPPGPICNPGVTALKAAVALAKTDFLYFVADGAGGHRFSRTFEEHRDAIAAGRRQREDAPSSDPAPVPKAGPADGAPPSPHSS